MKKAFYMMAAAAIALSSCSSEETTDVAKSSAISFRSTVGMNSRGAEVNTASLNDIWVSAFVDNAAVFSSEQFSKNGSSFESVHGPWFWDAGKTYKFMAFSPSATDLGVTPTVKENEITINSYVPSATIADQKDLLIADKKEGSSTDETSGVALEFNHVLSQIQVKVKNTNPNLKYIIRGIRISNVIASGDYAYTPANQDSHVWNTTGKAKSEYTYLLDQPITLDGNTTTGDLLTAVNSAMLIPQSLTSWDGNKADNLAGVTGSYISILLQVSKKNAAGTLEMVYPKDAHDDTQCGWAAVAIPAGDGWKYGNKYIYTLDLSKGAGKVDPVNPNPDGSDVVKPNVPGKDPDKGGNILGKPIFFTVDVKAWTENNPTINM